MNNINVLFDILKHDFVTEEGSPAAKEAVVEVVRQVVLDIHRIADALEALYINDVARLKEGK